MLKHLMLLVLLLLVILGINNSFGQDNSMHSIKIGLGYGMCMANTIQGTGPVYILGYQQELWNNRMRLNPILSIGQFSSKFMPLDARDQYFNATNLGANLNYDLIKLEPLSIVFSLGAFVNKTSGLKGTQADQEELYVQHFSEFINEYHFGGSLALGVRFNSGSKRTNFNFIPINVQIGTNNYLEFAPKFELEFKLWKQ